MSSINDRLCKIKARAAHEPLGSKSRSFPARMPLVSRSYGGGTGDAKRADTSGNTSPSLEPDTSGIRAAVPQVQFDANTSSNTSGKFENSQDIEKGSKDVSSDLGSNEPENQKKSQRVLKFAARIGTPLNLDLCIRWSPTDCKPYMVVGAEGEGSYRIKRVGKEHTREEIISKALWESVFVAGEQA